MLKIAISKRIQSESGVSDLCFKAAIRQGTIVGIFGNSGEGKSSILNMISGITTPDSGSIHFGDQVWLDRSKGVFAPIQKRNIGYVFQENSLFPHFTIKQNILYAVPKKEQAALNIDFLLEQVGLSKIQDSYPKQLSGGQIQRAVIARTLAQKAQLILMDEPFSGLDLEIKQRLYHQIKQLQATYKLTIILVTHDTNAIYQLCDEVYWVENHQCDTKMSRQEFKNGIEERIGKLKM